MIKPYNRTKGIKKQESSFPKLHYGYEFQSLDHQIMIYETEIILQLEIPKYKSGLIKNEQYFDNRVKYILNRG